MKMVVEDGQEPVLEHLCICAVVIFIPSLSRFKELERRLVFVIFVTSVKDRVGNS